MRKKVVRFFVNPIDGQEKWLNQMADRGLRLVDATKWYYVFDECVPCEYRYRIEFAADKSRKELERYKTFLQDLNIRTMEKNLNYNYSFGKARLRVYGGNSISVATSPGNMNSELLILEKKNDGAPFQIFTDNADRLQYYRKIRNAFLIVAVLLLVLLLFGTYNVPNRTVELIFRFFIAIPAAFSGIVMAQYCVRIHRIKKERRINE